MSLALGNRQLAMLREMGVRVWQPGSHSKPSAQTATAPTSVTAAPEMATKRAINTGAASARVLGATSSFDPKKQPVVADLTVDAGAPPAPARNASAWQIGELQTLYTTLAGPASQARWLVLLEAPASALQLPFNAFDGDAGKLLDNMLRATGMHTRGTVQLAALVRGSGSSPNLPAQLNDLLASAKADLVLVMGRLAAQAVLQSTEPLHKLRGQVHALGGEKNSVKTIVTLDPTYLLRNPLDKAKAWDDLCLALNVISVAGQNP